MAHGTGIAGYALLVLLLLGAGGCERQVAGGRTDGAELFAVACARCHGDKGKPMPHMASQLGVKDLSAAAFHDRVTDEDIRARIARGSENRRMPAFEGALTAEQIDALVRHVRGLRQASK